MPQCVRPVRRFLQRQGEKALTASFLVGVTLGQGEPPGPPHALCPTDPATRAFASRTARKWRARPWGAGQELYRPAGANGSDSCRRRC